MTCKDCIHCRACMHARMAALDPSWSRPFDKTKGICGDWQSADMKEVKPAKLELKTKTNAHCSNCDFIRNIETQIGWKYCPKCGAKMQEEEC